MAFVVLCFALMLAPWTAASPLQSQTITASKTRIKRHYGNYGNYYGNNYNYWPWCNNQYYNAHHPYYYYPCWGSWSLYPPNTTTPSTTTTTKPPYIIIVPINPPRPTRPTSPPITTTQPTTVPTRPPFTPIMPSVRPIRPFPYGRRMGRSLRERRGCNRICVDKHKMHYCCDTTTTQIPTTLASRGTCPPQTYPCTTPAANHTTQRGCKSDYQCPDDHGCCYDHCLQEYKCSRLLPQASTTTPTPRLSHHHKDETRAERSLQGEEQPAAVQETLATSQT